MAKKISYLASLNVYASELDDPQLIIRKIDDLHTMPEISGVELRFKSNPGASATPKDINNIRKICEHTDPHLKYLHLSSYGLTALEKQPQLMDYFHLIIGHYGRHDNVLGQIISNAQQMAMHGSRLGREYDTKRTNICDIINNSRKFVIENGSRVENRLSEIYEYARRHHRDLRGITFDMGHHALALLESDPKTGIPIEPIYKYLGKHGDIYTRAISEEILHAHGHGVEKIRGEFVDHKLPTKDTIRGAQLEIDRKLLRNAPNLISMTIELDQDLRTKENIITSIRNIEELILN